jgi:flagellar biosynthesis/type III secretory pathway protein FliH
MADKKQEVKDEGPAPTPAQLEEMRGQVQDLRNEKAAKAYQKRKQEGKENGMKKGGSCGSKRYAKGGSVRGGGCEVRGKTKGRMV